MGRIGGKVDVLILGLGWTGKYVAKQSEAEGVVFAATTRDGRNGTIAFAFDAESTDPTPFEALPTARTVLVTFPVLSGHAIDTLTAFYANTRTKPSQAVEPTKSVRWILLASTGNFTPVDPTQTPWCDRHTPLSNLTDRNKAESRLIELYPSTSTILHLAGLDDSTQRNPRNFISRIAPTKAAVAERKSVHYIHGVDVARAILAVHSNWKEGQHRWIITNMRVYDWWDFLGSAVPTEWSVAEKGIPDHWTWVLELMVEQGVLGLPRSVEELGKGISSREFWSAFGIQPIYTQL